MLHIDRDQTAVLDRLCPVSAGAGEAGAAAVSCTKLILWLVRNFLKAFNTCGSAAMIAGHYPSPSASPPDAPEAAVAFVILARE